MTRHPAVLARHALVAAVVTLFALAGPALAQDLPVPLPAVDQSTTGQAIAWSQATFATGSAPTVLIARDDDFADALAAGALSAELNAPLLLTDSDVLDPRTGAEITRLGADEAIILGGTEAVSEDVEAGLSAIGVESTRVAGENRADTAALILSTYFPNAAEVFVARGNPAEGDPTSAFADSLSLAGYAGGTGTPVLLTQTNVLWPETQAALEGSNVERVTVVGGQSAVNADIEAAIGQAIAGNQAVDAAAPSPREAVIRIAGAARDVTAIELSLQAGYGTPADAGRVILIEGYAETAWAGFASAPQAGNGAAVVIANGDSISDATTEFLSGSGVPLLCGPGTSPTACDAAAAAIAS